LNIQNIRYKRAIQAEPVATYTWNHLEEHCGARQSVAQIVARIRELKLMEKAMDEQFHSLLRETTDACDDILGRLNNILPLDRLKAQDPAHFQHYRYER
jgi:hypothetical protein